MDLNQALIERAQHVIPGGVNSPVPSFRLCRRRSALYRARQGPLYVGCDGQALHGLCLLLGAG